ncbi:hypothetical protein BJY27_008304 [Streptomyces rapamycinicus]|uniref:Transposase IS116/IS110/IS902 C-terminal domain-containing protein n=1 Tax=Streptomyces rapamycinicus TaxID=1226757 RepID=A0ABR6LY24_9ACTN|nr:hypothetical protein [Streptomyces rapamycinicus]
MAAHRPLPADSELVQAIAVLARAQQDAVWARGQAHNKLRSQLREFYPAILDAFAPHKHGLCSREARTILAAVPTLSMAAKLTRRRLHSLLRQAGRVRGIQAEAERLHEVFTRDYLHQLPQVETALGHQTSALVRQLNTACDNADQLEEAVTQAFEEHPDAPVIRSFPGLAALTGARVLAEIGDDRTRFANAGSLKAYAGSAPVTRASGKSCMVMSRKVKNQRLAAVGYVWAFVSLTRSPGARAHYDRRRAVGDRHVAAQRNLFNRFMGMLFHCLQNAHLRRSNRLPTALSRTYRSGSLTLIRVRCLVGQDQVRPGAGPSPPTRNAQAGHDIGESGCVTGLACGENERQRSAADRQRGGSNSSAVSPCTYVQGPTV